ncbi:MAG TPA: AtpZ/AtpI family protein [Armatimonadota bacterium]|jgi:F0F1-type ATP synthase assembly protein I
MARQWRQGELNGFALIAGAFVLVSMSFGGFALGYLVGRAFGHAMTGALIGLVLGTLVGFWDLYRIAARVMQQQPVPTAEEQRAAEENWEKSEKHEKSKGDRD